MSSTDKPSGDSPIEGLMKTAMENIRELVNVNTVIGEAVEASNGTVIIPVSRVSCGFVAGGGEYESGQAQQSLPFGGGSGAGVTVVPIGFLVVGTRVRFLPVETNAAVDRLLDLAPELIGKIKGRSGSGGGCTGGEKVDIEVQDLRHNQ